MELKTTYYPHRAVVLDGLRELFFSEYTFEVEATSAWRMPRYKGAVWHGGMGKVLKMICEETGQEEVYDQLFDTQVAPETSRSLQMGQNAPRPYVLVPPLSEAEYMAPGYRCTFTLVLVGWAKAWLPLFVEVFQRLGEQVGVGDRNDPTSGRFRVIQVRNHAGAVLYHAETGFSNLADIPWRTADFSAHDRPEAVMLRFLTPMRIRTHFRRPKPSLLRMADGTDMLALLDAQHRRLYQLTQLYCRPPEAFVQGYQGLLFDQVAPSLRHTAVSWQQWERYSYRQKSSMPWGGLIGEVILDGADMAPYLPLLHLGEHLHVGKNTTFGLGKYQLWKR